MRDFRATAIIERLSALAKARRPSPSLLPELLARLSALAKEKHFSPLLLTALLARVSAFAKAKRLSPLMLAALSLLSVTSTLSALFFLRALIGWGEAAPLTAPEWRPPSASFLTPLASAPAPTDIQTLTRPIFAKSRRPAPKAVETASPERAAGPPPALTVQAIVLSNGAWRAYLLDHGGANGEWYLVGQLIDGWTISEIRASELTLKSGERTAVLSLYPEPPALSEAETKPLPPSTPFVDPRAENPRRR